MTDFYWKKLHCRNFVFEVIEVIENLIEILSTIIYWLSQYESNFLLMESFWKSLKNCNESFSNCMERTFEETRYVNFNFWCHLDYYLALPHNFFYLQFFFFLVVNLHAFSIAVFSRFVPHKNLSLRNDFRWFKLLLLFPTEISQTD